MKFFRITYLILLCAFFPALGIKNKIIFQVSPARCLATAALRMWEARGDFIVMNEPMMYAYVMKHQPNKDPNIGKSEIPETYDQFIEQIFLLAENHPVFVKEESSVMFDYLWRNQSILQDSRVHFVFIVRNPHHALVSFYNRHKKIIKDFSYFSGFQPCYEVFQMVEKNGVNPPILVSAEDLYNDPEKTAKTLCHALDISFIEQMLHWESLGDDFIGKKWFDLKDKPTLYHWHSDAIKSTSFHKPTSYEVDAQGKPTFSEISNIEDREECIKAYHFNKIFYDLLIKEHLPSTQQYASSRSSVT